MHSMRSFLNCVLGIGLLFAAAAMAQEIAPAVRIVNPIDEHQLVTLQGTVHPLANARNDLGAAPDEMKLERIHLVLKRSAGQEAALRQRIAEMHTPGTASYHKWLTPDEFGKQFGASDEDIATVQKWLASHGFSAAKVNPGKQTLEFSGNVAQFRDAFHTQIHRYNVNGQTRTANASDPRIPAALAPVVGGFMSLNNFPPASSSHSLGTAEYDPKTNRAKPDWTIPSNLTGLSFPLSPQDFWVQYDLNPLYSAGVNGAGQTIAIINDSNIDVGQVNAFRSLFGLPANPPQVIIDGNDPGLNGVNDPHLPNDLLSQPYLQVEWAGAIAPNATIDLVIAADTALEYGFLLAAEHAVYSNVAPVISMSYGSCEGKDYNFNLTIGSLWEQAAAQGQTVVNATGDTGPAACDVTAYPYASMGLGLNALGSTPWNVSVGGTDFYYSQYNGSFTALEAQLGSYWNLSPSPGAPAVSILGVIPEQPLNDSQYGQNIFDYYANTGTTSIFAGGGGASQVWAKPAWQSGNGVPNDGVRDVPDLSLFAGVGVNLSYYPGCAYDGDCQTASSSGSVHISAWGGTPVSAAAFAGMMALVNQQYGPQGQADFVLYPLAAQYPAVFHDVTTGSNTVPCDLTDATPDCIAVSNPIVVIGITEGEIGAGTTAMYSAGPGYDLTSGLGTIDANQMVTNWNKVKFGATTTTLTPSATSFAHGASITVSGTVTAASGTPTGAVDLLTDSTEPNNQSQTPFLLYNGAFSDSVYYLPGGTYNIWGQYGGDGVYGMSASAKTQITVTPEASITQTIITNAALATIPSGTTNIPYGSQLIAQAQPLPAAFYNQCIVSANPPASCPPGYATPTGTVTFTDNGATINAAVLNEEGDAEYNAVFGVGSHSVVASYGGDNSYAASTGAPITFSVVKDAPMVWMSSPAFIANSSPQQVQGGQNMVFQILVTNSANLFQLSNPCNMPLLTPAAAPTGSITVTGFPAGVTNTATLSPEYDPFFNAFEGAANLSLPASTPPGTYNLTISYAGDANYAANSASQTIVVAAATGLASTTSATMTGSISPASSGITISGTVTGQSGSPAPTGSVTVYSNGSGVGSPLPLTSSAGETSSFTGTINGSVLPPGTNLIVVQYGGDAVYNPSATTLNPVANSNADFSLQTATPIVGVTAGASGTATINVISMLGFTGSVSLTCAVAPGVTCTISPAAALTANGSATATLTIDATADTANLAYDVLVTGTDSTGAYIHTLGVIAQVSGSPAGTQSFVMNNSGDITISNTSAASGQATITLTPVGEYAGTVTLSCSVNNPAGASKPPACSFSKTQITFSGSAAQTATLTIGSATSSSALNRPVKLFWPSAGGTALALIFFFGIPKRRRNWLTALLGLLMMVTSFAGLGCGGSSSAALSTGTYSVTVTGTAGVIKQTTTFNVTVK
jgi:hypothetical protein